MVTNDGSVSPNLLRPLRSYEEVMRERADADRSDACRDIARKNMMSRSVRQDGDDVESYQ